MWSICTTKRHSVLSKEGILTHTSMWISLEDIVLSDISQSQKEKKL
jgi:hypothetical protein